MRAETIPNYEIGALIHPDIHTQTPQQVRRALEAHQATFPGHYRITEACNSVHNEAWRRWAGKKQTLARALVVAEAVSERPAVTLSIPRAAVPHPALGDPRSTRKDAEFFAARLRQVVMEMAGMVPNSPEWQIARSSAFNYRRRALLRARADKVEPPELPSVPGIPPHLWAHFGRTAVHDDPRHAADRTRHRDTYEPKRKDGAA